MAEKGAHTESSNTTIITTARAALSNDSISRLLKQKLMEVLCCEPHEEVRGSTLTHSWTTSLPPTSDRSNRTTRFSSVNGEEPVKAVNSAYQEHTEQHQSEGQRGHSYDERRRVHAQGQASYGGRIGLPLRRAISGQGRGQESRSA